MSNAAVGRGRQEDEALDPDLPGLVVLPLEYALEHRCT